MASPPPPPPFSKPIDKAPLHFALVLFPIFQALDVFGPIDALNTIKRRYPDFPLRLSILAATTEPVSTLPAPPSLGPPFEQKITPTHTFDQPPTEPIDILFIPGGIGTRLANEPGWRPVLDYLNAFFANERNVKSLKGIFTVCTGSLLFARVLVPKEGEGGGAGEKKGILEGVRATTNKSAFLLALQEHPRVDWEARGRWVRTDLAVPLSTPEGTPTTHHTVKLWTTSGVSAGTDGMFALINEEYGAEVASFIAVNLEYRLITDPTNDPFAVVL